MLATNTYGSASQSLLLRCERRSPGLKPACGGQPLLRGFAAEYSYLLEYMPWVAGADGKGDRNVRSYFVHTMQP